MRGCCPSWFGFRVVKEGSEADTAADVERPFIDNDLPWDGDDDWGAVEEPVKSPEQIISPSTACGVSPPACGALQGAAMPTDSTLQLAGSSKPPTPLTHGVAARGEAPQQSESDPFAELGMAPVLQPERQRKHVVQHPSLWADHGRTPRALRLEDEVNTEAQGDWAAGELDLDKEEEDLR